jgi:hypothetical protein
MASRVGADEEHERVELGTDRRVLASSVPSELAKSGGGEEREKRIDVLEVGFCESVEVVQVRYLSLEKSKGLTEKRLEES